jgi:hypothetical protein
MVAPPMTGPPAIDLKHSWPARRHFWRPPFLNRIATVVGSSHGKPKALDFIR